MNVVTPAASGSLSNLTLASTIHNNVTRWMEMAVSFEEHVGIPNEIVVVDDGSAEPVSITGLKSRIRLIRHPVALGFCAASTVALRAVTTPFGLLVDADITFLPGAFTAAFACFQQAARVAWCNFSQIDRVGSKGSSVDRVIPPAWCFGLGNQVTACWIKSKTGFATVCANDKIEHVAIAHSSSVFVRMSAYESVGGFDLRYWQCQADNDLCRRLYKRGWAVGIYSGYCVIHDGIGGKTGGVRRVYDLYRGQLMFYETHEPWSRFYLRPLLALRHLAEALCLWIRPRKGAHLRPAWRLVLAWQALRAYPSQSSSSLHGTSRV